MFHHAEGEPSFKLIFNRERDALVPWFRTFQPFFSGNLAISIVEMLGAMNKEIRLEARSAFYRSAVISLQGECPEGGDYHTMVQRFLDGAGEEGRASLPHVNIMYLDFSVLDFGLVGYASFQGVMHSLLL
jgi:hypothetical protein